MSEKGIKPLKKVTKTMGKKTLQCKIQNSEKSDWNIEIVTTKVFFSWLMGRQHKG